MFMHICTYVCMYVSIYERIYVCICVCIMYYACVYYVHAVQNVWTYLAPAFLMADLGLVLHVYYQSVLPGQA